MTKKKEGRLFLCLVHNNTDDSVIVFLQLKRCHLIEFLLSPCGATKVIWQRHLTSKVTSELTLENLLSYIYSLLYCSRVKVMLAVELFIKERLGIYGIYIICVCV